VCSKLQVPTYTQLLKLTLLQVNVCVYIAQTKCSRYYNCALRNFTAPLFETLVFMLGLHGAKRLCDEFDDEALLTSLFDTVNSIYYFEDL
jgi:hypothetical protein